MASTSQDGRKRKRFAGDGDGDEVEVGVGDGDGDGDGVGDGDEETIRLQDQLIEVLERNGRMLSAQLEAQNTNFQLDREQRKDQADCLVAVLSKLADALGRIADKL